MRAVNLIPVDDRRAGTTGASRSGGMVYLLLGALFMGLVMIVAVTLVNRSLSDKRTELADVKAQADAEQAKAAALEPYTRFAQLRAKRVETVKSLAASRFDWAHAMHEVARVIPENVALQSFNGKVGQSTGASSPSIEIGGCTTSQKSVARMMARMRLVDGVQHVGLKSSEKGGDSSGGGSTSGAAGAGCGTSDQAPTFQMVITFAAKPVAAPAATAGAAAPTTPSTPTTGSKP